MRECFVSLYAALTLYHDFDQRIQMDSLKWQGWCSELEPQLEYIPELVRQIRNNALKDQLKGRMTPTLSDIKQLLSSIQRNQNSLNSPKALPGPLQPDEKQRMGSLIRQLNENPPDVSDFKQPPRWSRSQWDAYLDRKYPRRRNR